MPEPDRSDARSSRAGEARPDPSAPGSDPLWLSEARYRAIVEDQPDLVCRFLSDGTITFVNDAYCRFFGLRRDEAMGRPYQPVVHPDDLPHVLAKVAALSPANPVVFIENRVRRADGAMRWTEWTNRAIYGADGRLLEYQSSGRDVTDRRRMHEETARLAAIVASADLAIYSTTPGGVITSWNRAAERMFGYTAAEAIGRPLDAVLPHATPLADLDIAGRVNRGETIEHIETEKIARNGARVPVSLTVSPITDDAGRVVGISRIAQDITDRRRAERELQERESRFRLVADQAPVLIWVADTANRGTYFNQPWLEFTGVPLERQLGDGWLSLIHPDDRAGAGAYCQQHFEQRLPFTMEFRLRHHSGDYRWVEDSGRPLFLPDGTFNGYIGSCIDIEDRKRLERAQQQAVAHETEARTAAEEASRLKDEFLAVVSHELRTPLNAILGWTRMLRDGTVAPDGAAKALEVIERNARIQAQLVADLLDVSRIVSGKLALRVEPVEVAGLVAASVDAVRPAAANKGIELSVDLAACGVAVLGDAARLQQAFWNLLVNAIKFTPRHGRVSVALARIGDDLEVTVRDTGVGIPADALPVIFDRFRQADGRTTRAHGGLGLGLAIVEHVAVAHGGSVQAESEGAGRGATFRILLPASGVVAAEERRPRIVADRPDLSGCGVLVVDDDADARALVRAVLERCGAAVTTAGSVSEALEAARAAAPDLLVGDIGMPEQDGYDLIRLFRSVKELQGVPALALTAYGGAQHREEALRAGYDAHLGKPIDPDALCDVVHALHRGVPEP